MAAELSADTPLFSLASPGIAFAPAVTPDTYQHAASSSAPPSIDYPLTEAELLSLDFDDLEPRRSGKRKATNHIPRPPNAFILFRSAFIRSQRVTSGVESSHSTLSKIIGLTWQQLSNEERQKWHAKAKVAQEEHKRKYPGYSFKPVHQRLKGAGLARRKLREVGLKDQKRCEKIAELLAEGKKGRELEDAVREFDKHHVPQVVTRFEEPITASSFDCSSRGSSPFSTYSRRSTTPSSQGRTSRSGIPTPPPVEQPEQITQLLSFNSNALFPTHSFDIDNFGFSVQLPSPAINTVVAPLMGSDVVEGYGDVPHCDPNPPLSLRFAHIDEWAPAPCSPVSPQHSTDNLPTTPVDSQTAFADPHLHHDALYSDRHAYPAFAPDAAVPQGRYHHASSDDECPRPFPSYVPNFTGYTEYHAYSAPLPTVQQTCHGASLKRAEGVAACYGGAAGHGHVRPNPMARDDLDFSFFMESFDPYPL